MNTEAEAVAKLATENADTQIVPIERGNVDKCDVLAVPNGFRLESLKKFVDEYRPVPERKTGTAILRELDSFILHTNRFKDANSVVFADPNPDKPRLLTVFDYNEQGEGSPRWGQHRAKYPFPLSEEWKAWRQLDNKPMSQDQFAHFLEDRITDVVAPENAGESGKAFVAQIGCEFASPSRLLELSKGLSVFVAAQVANHTNLSTGETQIVFAESHSASANGQRQLKVPGAFLLGLPVFKAGAPYQVAARLRYRVREGAITWFYTLYRTDRVFDHAFKEACEKTAKDTGLPVLVGRPEFVEGREDE